MARRVCGDDLGGVWPEAHRVVAKRLAGWTDDDSGTGRIKAEGRADGIWMAVRTNELQPAAETHAEVKQERTIH